MIIIIRQNQNYYNYENNNIGNYFVNIIQFLIISFFCKNMNDLNNNNCCFH